MLAFLSPAPLISQVSSLRLDVGTSSFTEKSNKSSRSAHFVLPSLRQRRIVFCTVPSPPPSSALPSTSYVPDEEKRILEKKDLSPKVNLRTSWRDVLNGIYELALPLWGGNRKLVAYLWTASTIILAFATTAHAVLLSMTSRLFWNCLAAKDLSKFGQVLTMYIITVAVGPIAIALFTWVKNRLALMWRRSLTNHFLSRYFNSLNYYKLTLGKSSIDNPDQRISEDVRLFTARAVRFMTIIGVGVFDFIVFSFILHRIYAPLLYILFLYSFIGTLLIVFAGRDLLRLNRQQIMCEADFRYGLVRVRESTESIAFYKGEPAEKSELLLRFTMAFRNSINLLGMDRNIDFFSTSFRYYAQLVPLMVIAPRYFAGAVQLGVMSQVFFSFNHVLSSVGLIVQEFQALAEFAAGVRRLETLSDAMSNDSNDYIRDSKIESHIDDGDDANALILRNVSVLTPSEPPRTLAINVNIEVASGERLLVIGQSGIGKSSLMRAVCGLWDYGEGTIERPSSKNTMFLPQRPFVMLGTLRENVIYPSTRTDVTDDEVKDVLRRVNLGYLLETVGGLTAPGEGLSSRLSFGEQQRLGFARILIARPKLVVLDESTSALDLGNERKMYSLISEVGVTCISVGNRPSLLDFHSKVLRLEENGAWSMMSPESVKDEDKRSLSV